MEVSTRIRAFVAPGLRSQAAELCSLSTAPPPMCPKSRSAQNPPKIAPNSMIQKEILVLFFLQLNVTYLTFRSAGRVVRQIEPCA